MVAGCGLGGGGGGSADFLAVKYAPLGAAASSPLGVFGVNPVLRLDDAKLGSRRSGFGLAFGVGLELP